MKSLAIIFAVLLSSVSALASDLAIQQSTLYPFRSSIALQDDFLYGTVGAGNVGDLGWSTAGTVTIPSSEANRLGLYNFDTSAVSGTQARVNGPIGAQIDPALSHRVIWAFRLNTNDVNTTIRAGAQNSANGNPPANGIYLEKLDADTNWFCITRAATVETRVNSGVAVTTNFITVAYTRNGSGVQFSIDRVNVCGLMTATIPTVFINPEIFIINSAVAAKTFDVDYFQLNLAGLVR